MFHTYYGPVMYRAHPGLYPPGMVGKLPQNKGTLQKHLGAHKQKTPAQQQSLPLQRDDDEERSTESPKQENSSQRTLPPRLQQNTPTHGAKKSSPGKGLVALNVMPRMPMYPPYYPYPYMLAQEDPRYMGIGMPPQPPYYYTYGNMPRAQYPYMMPHPVPMQVHPRQGSGSVSPASSSEGTARGTNPTSPTGSNTDSQSVSPGSGAGFQPHQHIQVLPNVKHVPSHLLYNTPGSGSNSRSSTPVMANSPVPNQQGARDSPRNSQGELDIAYTRRRQHSGPRPVSQSPSYSSQSSHESSASPVLNGDQMSSAQKQSDKALPHKQHGGVSEQQASVTSRMQKQLRLNTNAAGFGGQIGDELATPTEIRNIVKMIEENIDEGDEEESLFSKQQTKPSPPAGKLFLHLPIRTAPNEVQQSSSGSSQDEDLRQMYAGPPPRQQLPSYRETEFDPAQLEPQTPMTPAGFHTPGTDLNTDPLEILRNLTINSDNLNRSTHGHF